MTEIPSAPQLRALADDYRTATDRAEQLYTANEMATALEAVPETAAHVFTDATHYAVPRSWALRATAAERTQAHLRLLIAGNGETEPEYHTWQMRQAAAEHLPELLADLWLLADEYDLDHNRLLADSRSLADNAR